MAIIGNKKYNKLLERTGSYMLELRKSNPDEVEKIVEFESASDVSSCIISYTKEKHIAEIKNDSVVYLSIYEKNIFSGFIILSIENELRTELRRIVVGEKGKGIGQSAISMMEKYCKEELRCERIWLDVFESNVRGQHIYRKMGFTETGKGLYNDKKLLYFEKML